MDSNFATYTGAAIGAAAVAYYVTKKPTKIDPFYDFENQSVEIDEIEHIRVATSLKNKPLVLYRDENVRTLYDVLPKGMQISGNGACLGYRKDGKGPYLWITYADVIERTRFIGSGLLYKGLKPDNSTNIGIYSRNRIEWTVSEYACYTYSMNVVSLYDTYGKDSVKYILNQAEISAVFLDSLNRLTNIAHIIHELPYLRFIIHFDELSSYDVEKLNLPSNVELIYFNDLMKLGRNNIRSPVPPKPSDSATICYTSGTTGNPKGAIITHSNLICNEAAINERLHKPHLNVKGTNATDPLPVYMCYLPLAHMLERMSTIKLFMEGGRIGYISGDITTLLDDCKELKPTNIPMVPRLLNKLYDRVITEIGNNKIKMLLLKRAIALKEANRKNGIVRQDTIYDKLIFNKIRQLFGGNVIRTATGSAPITKEVMEFSRALFSCPIPEGYGQTEATCTITFCHPLEPEIGHVGPPSDVCMVKLVDIPEMGYFAKEGKGEICAKGPGVFKGYFKEPEKTAEVIDKDGWLHTGDVGMWLPNGCLKIIDRKKHLFKLSQGEYVSPERVENIYVRSLFVSQIFIEGDSLKDFVVAIVVPEEEYLMKYCKFRNINGTFQELCRKQEIRKIILDDMNAIAQSNGLMPYERARNIYLHDTLFSIENGLATPTMKLKRVQLRQFFKDTVKALYDEVSVKSPKL